MDRETRVALVLAAVLSFGIGGGLMLCVGRGEGGHAETATPALFDGEVGIQLVSPTDVTVTSGFLDKHSENLNLALQSARVVPIEETPGVLKGFQIVRLDPGSLWEQFGLLEGDKLLALNDFELNAPESGLRAFQEIRSSKVVVLKLERSGAPMSIRYQIVDSQK